VSVDFWNAFSRLLLVYLKFYLREIDVNVSDLSTGEFSFNQLVVLIYERLLLVGEYSVINWFLDGVTGLF
jgi:hypothetical protein